MSTPEIEPDLFPRAHEFGRLSRCRASWLLAKRALEVGQVAHTDTIYTAAGTRLHEANLNGAEELGTEERPNWDRVQERRQAFLESWADGEKFESVKEERLVVRQGLRILASGQPDEVVLQGERAAVLDAKFGWQEVSQPRVNWQLCVYALAVWQHYGITAITVQLLSPFHSYEPFTYGLEELSKALKSVALIVGQLADPPEPRVGDWCRYCQARVICKAAKQEAGRVAQLSLAELPKGEKAGKILHEISRAEELFSEIKRFYKELLAREPEAVSGWKLSAGTLRRWIPNVFKAWMSLEDKVSLTQFLEACSMSVSNLEGLLEDKAKLKGAELGEVVEPLTASKRTAPSLQAVTTKGKTK